MSPPKTASKPVPVAAKTAAEPVPVAAKPAAEPAKTVDCKLLPHIAEKWKCTKDDAGRIYYYNTDGETQYDSPNPIIKEGSFISGATHLYAMSTIMFLSSVSYITLAGLFLTDVNETDFTDEGVKKSLHIILGSIIGLSIIALLHSSYLIIMKYKGDSTKEIGKWERFFMFLYQLFIGILTLLLYFMSSSDVTSKYPATNKYMVGLGSLSGSLTAITTFIHIFTDCNC